MERNRHDKLRNAWETTTPQPQDDFTKQVMKKIASSEQNHTVSIRRWAVAASVLAFVGLAAWWYMKPTVQEATVAYKIITTKEVIKDTLPSAASPSDEVLMAQADKPEEATPQSPAHKKRAKKRANRVPHQDKTDNRVETVEPANELAQTVEESAATYLSTPPSSEELFATQAADIRRRGEQVMHHVAVLDQQVKSGMQLVEF